MDKSIGKLRRALFSIGVVLSISGLAVTKPNIDSLTIKRKDGLISIIDSTKQTANIKAQGSPISDSTEHKKKIRIYNRLNMPFEYDRPYFYDVWRITPYIYSFERERKWLNLPIESNRELNEYFSIDSLRKEIYHHILFSNPELIVGLRKSAPVIPEEAKKEPSVEAFSKLKPLSGIHSSREFLAASINANKIILSEFNKGHWTYVNKSSLQFSQNYISENWQQGGESNLALNGLVNMKANYVSEGGLTINHEVEWRSSFYTSPTDTVRSWRVTDDVFRITTIVGIKAFQKFNYSSTVEFKTRFFNSFRTNSNTKLASFLSPAEFSLSVGLSYADDIDKLKVKGLKASLSPCSYNCKYVREYNKIDVTRYGLDSGTHFMNQLGSRMDLKFTCVIKKNISWDLRHYYFTSYQNVEAEWENTLNFAVNRHFSTKIFVDVKYDDKRKLENSRDSYFQYKELLSFGLSYVW